MSPGDASVVHLMLRALFVMKNGIRGTWITLSNDKTLELYQALQFLEHFHIYHLTLFSQPSVHCRGHISPLAVEQLCPGNTGPTPSPEALSIAPLLEMKDPALSPRHGGSGGGSSPKIS